MSQAQRFSVCNRTPAKLFHPVGHHDRACVPARSSGQQASIRITLPTRAFNLCLLLLRSSRPLGSELASFLSTSFQQLFTIRKFPHQFKMNYANMIEERKLKASIQQFPHSTSIESNNPTARLHHRHPHLHHRRHLHHRNQPLRPHHRKAQAIPPRPGAGPKDPRPRTPRR